MRVEQVDMSDWRAALPDSGFEVFHTPEALGVLDDHSPGDLELLVAYKGDRPVGLLPAFTVSHAIGTAILSPPPSMNVPRLGPITMPASPKRRSREKLNREFAERSLEALGTDGVATMLRIICPPTYRDPRPYIWDGLDVETSFTYSLETEQRTADDILGSFSKSLRRDIRNAIDHEVDVVEEGPESAEAVYRSTANRYQEQDESYPLQWPYVRELTRSLADVDRCRVFVARSKAGEFVSGVTVLYSNDAAYFWQGGAKIRDHDVSVNSLLHWRIIEDLIENSPRESISRYDLMGANTERLCQYKSKFGGELQPYYVVESDGAPIRWAKAAYRLLGR